MDKSIKEHRKIIASLEYGIIYSLIFIYFVYFTIILCIMGTILAICISVFDKEYLALTILPFFLIGIVVLVYILCFNHKQRKYIEPFLNDDFFELTAKVVMVDKTITMGLVKIPIAKIAVVFTYNGIELVKQSGRKDFEKSNLKNYKTGYNAIFYKYANRQIQILYSPKYDQVLILKDKKQAKKR